ncbi:acyl carrier protein, partial [Saccharothrix longispora]|uniref:acyl carrier protein n=1 Tax=Saccharothrix longispora TaxID=33920 RepID=UPI0028FD590C
MLDELIVILTDTIGVPVEDIGPDTTPEQVELDSLALVELSVALEEKLGVAITERELKDLPTVGAIAELVADRTGR